MNRSITTALLSAAALAAQSSAAIGAPAQMPSLALVIHVAGPPCCDQNLAAADVALRAPEELGEPLNSLHAHPGAKIAFAIEPAYLAALERAAAGQTSFTGIEKSPPRSASAEPLLGLLARHRPLTTSIARTPEGERYLALSTAAAARLAGESGVTFSTHEFVDFVGTDVDVVLAASSAASMPRGAQPLDRTLASLAHADRDVEDELAAGVRDGTVELIATPDDDPVLPLIADSGGKTSADPYIVEVGSHADAQWLVTDALRSVCANAANASCGFYSPFGAYDDETAAIFQEAGAAFALFSDRVVHGTGGQGTQEGMDTGRAAALHAYALAVAKNETLQTCFWDEALSDELDTLGGTEAAMSELLISAGRQAAGDAANDPYAHVLIVRLDSEGDWAQRPDARAVTDRLIEAIASGRAGRATTVGEFVRAHPAQAPAYGFPPNSELGSFAYWMGTPNQASMWRALAAARTAAGGDGMLNHASVRDLVFSAEAAKWYSILDLPESTGEQQSKLTAFRALISSIYRAAGASPPANIAPLRAPTPAPAPPSPSPSPSPSPTPSGGR